MRVKANTDFSGDVGDSSSLSNAMITAHRHLPLRSRCRSEQAFRRDRRRQPYASRDRGQGREVVLRAIAISQGSCLSGHANFANIWMVLSARSGLLFPIPQTSASQSIALASMHRHQERYSAPPSTPRTLPVTQRDASDAKNRHAAAMSSGCPKVPSGMNLSILLATSGALSK